MDPGVDHGDPAIVTMGVFMGYESFNFQDLF